MKRIVRCFLLGCASLFGCSMHMPSVAPHQRPTGKEAIVYGRFEVVGDAPFAPGVAHSSMALVMRCEDGREYRIRFDDGEPIVVMAVAPSTCWLDEVFYLDSINTTLGQSALPDRVRRRIRLDAGQAYYLGDFRGTVALDFSDNNFRERFEVKEWTGGPTTTRQEFRDKFPNLRGFAAVDALTPAGE